MNKAKRRVVLLSQGEGMPQSFSGRFRKVDCHKNFFKTPERLHGLVPIRFGLVGRFHWSTMAGSNALGLRNVEGCGVVGNHIYGTVGALRAG